MKNFAITFLFAATCFAHLHAQGISVDGGSGGSIDDGTFRVPASGTFNVTEPTAQAASVATHLEHSVDYSTGRASLSIELCRLEGGGGLSLPVRLSHSTGGLKPRQEPGMVGIGWDFDCGGFISRTIVGRPDEEGTLTFCDNYEASMDTLVKYVTHVKDSGADRYSFRAGDASGEFFIKNGQCVLMPRNDVRIERINYNKSSGGFISYDFVATTADGTTYYFEHGETVWHKYLEYNVSKVPGNRGYEKVIREWHLAKIVNAQRSDSILLHYVPFKKRPL